jgi:hypothetical protein
VHNTFLVNIAWTAELWSAATRRRCGGRDMSRPLKAPKSLAYTKGKTRLSRDHCGRENLVVQASRLLPEAAETAAPQLS